MSEPDNLDWFTIPKEALSPSAGVNLDTSSPPKLASQLATLRRLMDRIEGRTLDRNHVPGCPGRCLPALADATTPRDRRALQNVCQTISDLLPQGYRVHYIHDRRLVPIGCPDGVTPVVRPEPKGGKTTARITDLVEKLVPIIAAPLTIVAEATVICHPDATYNKMVGRALSLGRALEKSGLLS